MLEERPSENLEVASLSKLARLETEEPIYSLSGKLSVCQEGQIFNLYLTWSSVLPSLLQTGQSPGRGQLFGSGPLGGQERTAGEGYGTYITKGFLRPFLAKIYL